MVFEVNVVRELVGLDESAEEMFIDGQHLCYLNLFINYGFAFYLIKIEIILSPIISYLFDIILS